MSGSRVVPRQPFGREDARRLAVAHGLGFMGPVDATETVPYEELWQTPDGRNVVHYIEDFILNLPHLVVEGEAPEELVRDLRHDLVDPYAPEDAIELAREGGTREQRLHAVALLAATAPYSPRDDFIERFRVALEDPEPDVRLLSVFATAYPAWRELIEPLRARADDDPDSRVREAAAQMAANLKEQVG